jgi:hypothetical protein
MKRAIAMIIGSAALMLGLTAGTANAATPAVPNPPANYALTYSHSFQTQGYGNWTEAVSYPGTVIMDRYGIGLEISQPNQYTGIRNTLNITPNTFIQAVMYVPWASVNGHRQIDNWPAWWMCGSVCPGSGTRADGEIDMLEGLHGQSCATTHYYASNAQDEQCVTGDQDSGWVTVSILWTNGQVKVWYKDTLIGTLTQPETAPETLQFQNTTDNECAWCLGPFAKSTMYLSWVHIYQLK